MRRIRQHTSAYVSIRRAGGARSGCCRPAACVAYVSIRQHTSAYVGREEHVVVAVVQLQSEVQLVA
jgi:hypothetical protein